MGGRARACQRAGRGLDVLVRAVAAPVRRCAPPETPASPRDLDGQRALVVDDNATNRRILRQQLLSWGVEPVEAADGDEALDAAAAAASAGEALRLRRHRPQHARHGRHRAGADAEGATPRPRR